MGLKGREIVERAGVDVSTLIKILNQAYCDEWLSYYQYWIGAKVVAGPQSHALIAELEEHAQEELEHARKLAQRIIELGGTPAISPEDWMEESTCGYLAPSNPDAAEIVSQNLQAERCAIEVYNRILERLRGRDVVTAHIIREILEDEIEHEEDLETFKASGKKKISKSDN